MTKVKHKQTEHHRISNHSPAVFINVQNFVEINTALSTSFNILRLRLELKFTPPKLGVWGQNRGTGGATLTPNKLVLTFGSCYLSATFGENWWRNATVRVHTHRQTDRQTDGYAQTHHHHTTTVLRLFYAQTQTNWIHNLSHAICYSYGADK